MNALAPETVLAAFAVFCRVGGCLMIAPGFSSSAIPVRMRLYVAIALSLAFTPLLFGQMKPAIGDGGPGALLPLIFSETATGALIGLIGRIFFAALQLVGVAITQAIGLGGMPGTVMEDHDQVPALATLFTLTATTLMFAAGLHRELIRGVFDSYGTIPPGQIFAARLALVDIADEARAAFLVALRIASPFLVYSIIVNLALGITNKLTPQIPVYFIAVPFVMAGGLVLLALTVGDFMTSFLAAFDGWLSGR